MTSSILILDYNQKEESKTLLESIKANAIFDKKVYFLANGNSEDYAYENYKDGLIDVLISNKENRGKLVALYQFNIVFGILIAYFSNYLLQGVGGGIDWRLMLGVEAIPAFIYIIFVLNITKDIIKFIKHRIT